MKLKRVLKIILLTLCVLISGFLIVLIYMVLFVENASLESSLIFPFFMISTGVLSVSYHAKTLKFYNFKIKTFFLNNVVLWIGNVVFALTQIFTSLYLSYSFYNVFKSKKTTEIYMACAICFLLFVFCCLFLVCL